MNAGRKQPHESTRQRETRHRRLRGGKFCLYYHLLTNILSLTIYHLVAIIHTAGARAISFLNDGSNSTIAATLEKSFFCTRNIILILLLFIHILTLLLFYSTVEGERGEDGDEGGMDRGEGGEEEDKNEE